MENRGYIRVTDACRCACFAQKAKPSGLVTEISLADDFQCHRAVQVDVERLVSHPHCTATQLDRFAVFALYQFIVLKSLHRQLQCRLDRFLRTRLAGFSPTGESLAQHANRTELHCSGKLIAADRTDASIVRLHGPNRPSNATGASPRSSMPQCFPAPDEWIIRIPAKLRERRSETSCLNRTPQKKNTLPRAKPNPTPPPPRTLSS